jgi:hypothetical protein
MDLLSARMGNILLMAPAEKTFNSPIMNIRDTSVWTSSTQERFQTTRAKLYKLRELHSIVSVIRDFQFFVAEKWEIASDKQGSSNTAQYGQHCQNCRLVECQWRI